MPWTYKQNLKLQIVEAKFSGTTTARDLQECTSELIALEKEKGMNRFLVDATGMEYAGSLVDVYNLPSKQYLEEGADVGGRVAVLFPASPDDKEAVQFYETVCVNRGWDVRAFSERQEAMTWLTRSTTSSEPDARGAS
jgi:hypothetical protein